MGKYSIKEIEVLSGVKAHTLRIWEQRYNLVVPERTDTNIRYYTDCQLRQILNIALLNQHGIKISNIVKLSEEDIHRKVKELQDEETPHDFYINALINAMIQLDEAEFSKTIDLALNKYSFADFSSDIVFTFLKRIGILWVSGSISPAQEHFASNILKRKVIVAIDNLKVEKKQNFKKFLLFLPEGEFHELSLLLSEYLLVNEGHKSYYFGASLPVTDLKDVLKTIDVDYLFCVMLVNKSMDEIQEDINTISKLADKRKVLIAGSQLVFNSLKFPKNCITIIDIHQFQTFLNTLK